MGVVPLRAASVLPLAGVLATLALALALVPAAQASPPAGRVIASVGEVTAQGTDGSERPLTRHDVVYPGETVRTAPRATVQLRMRDDAHIELEPASRLVIERYRHEPGGGVGAAVMRFLGGALRTITGGIGKEEAERYSMRTAVATIGIRGTQYALELCDTGCAREGRPAGLYGRVDEGAITARNDAGSEVFARREYFHVADPDTMPRRIVRPPEGILDGSGAVGPGGSWDSGGLGSLDGGGELLDGSGGLLGAGDGLLDTGGGLLDEGTDLLGTGGTLLEEDGDTLDGDGSLLTDDGELLEDAGNLLDATGSLLEED